MQKISVKTIYLILVISIGLVGLGVGSTFAMFTASSKIDNPISFTAGIFGESDVIETVEVTVPAGETKATNLHVTNSTNSNLNYVMWYIDEGLDIELGSKRTDSGTYQTTIGAGEEHQYEVSIRNNSNSDVTVVIGVSSGTGSVTLSSDMKMVPQSELKPTLASVITNLYISNTKTKVTNNSITYQYDTTNNLMQDTAGNIRYYGASPNNYVDIGDVYKSDVTKGKWEELEATFTTEEECKESFNCSINYAIFGYSSEDECNSDLPAIVQQEFGMTIEEFNNTYCVVETIPKGTPILYRIIGVFGDKIKVIRNESIGDYSWDTSASGINSGYGINEWSQADLMKLLNTGYESETVGGSLYYNSGSGTCYNGYRNATTSCDFTITGLSDNVKNKIAEVTWNLGGWNNSEVYPNQIYEYERGTNVVVPDITCSGTYCNDTITRTTSWTGKVALAYPSDYGYAADLTQCNQTLVNYDNATCTSNNWLYNGATQWLLTPQSSLADNSWIVGSSGNVNRNLNDGVYHELGVQPVLYLNSVLVIESGSGTESDPYRISA